MRMGSDVLHMVLGRAFISSCVVGACMFCRFVEAYLARRYIWRQRQAPFFHTLCAFAL